MSTPDPTNRSSASCVSEIPPLRVMEQEPCSPMPNPSTVRFVNMSAMVVITANSIIEPHVVLVRQMPHVVLAQQRQPGRAEFPDVRSRCFLTRHEGPAKVELVQQVWSL